MTETQVINIHEWHAALRMARLRALCVTAHNQLKNGVKPKVVQQQLKDGLRALPAFQTFLYQNFAPDHQAFTLPAQVNRFVQLMEEMATTRAYFAERCDAGLSRGETWHAIRLRYCMLYELGLFLGDVFRDRAVLDMKDLRRMVRAYIMLESQSPEFLEPDLLKLNKVLNPKTPDDEFIAALKKLTEHFEQGIHLWELIGPGRPKAIA